ncbi:MAG: class I SAM-dependent methyltransferase [Gemmatimonas sp.]
MRDIAQYQAAYLADYEFERHMVRFRRRTIMTWLATQPHTHMLEVGCGLEPLFEHVADWQHYTVVEPGAEFAARARQRAPEGRDVEVHQAYLEDAGALLAGQTFDCIVVSSLLHEVSDPARLLASLRALCTRETRVHVNVPNAASLHNRLAVKMGLIPDIFSRSALAERMQRSTTYDLTRLCGAMESAGFHVETSGSFFLKPFTHAQLKAMLAHQIIDEKVLDALYEVNADFEGLGAEIFVNAVPV